LRGKVAVNQSLKLLLLGLTPFVAGTALNAAIPTVFQSFSVLHSTVLLGVWGFMSYKIRSPKDTALRNAISIHVPALAVFLLAMYQVYLRGEYWPNALGILTQFYYLPVIALAARIVNLFSDFIGAWQVYMAGLRRCL